MNAVDSAEGAVVMGEVTNEDTVPAFVTVNATLVDGAGNPIDDESSFDKSPPFCCPNKSPRTAFDFPNLNLKNVKNVHMDVRQLWSRHPADPVIGVMNQKIDTDPQGKSVLRGDLLNQSGQTVNIRTSSPASTTTTARSCGYRMAYVDRALLPLSSEPFAVELPKTYRRRCTVFHVVVNQFQHRQVLV